LKNGRQYCSHPVLDSRLENKYLYAPPQKMYIMHIQSIFININMCTDNNIFLKRTAHIIHTFMNMMLSKAIQSGNSLEIRYMTYLTAIIVAASYIKHMCFYILLATSNNVVSNPCPAGGGGGFYVVYNLYVINECFFALKNFYHQLYCIFATSLVYPGPIG
jgi:hypothetical protein